LIFHKGECKKRDKLAEESNLSNNHRLNERTGYPRKPEV
jgi:hypothetical protein